VVDQILFLPGEATKYETERDIVRDSLIVKLCKCYLMPLHVPSYQHSDDFLIRDTIQYCMLPYANQQRISICNFHMNGGNCFMSVYQVVKVYLESASLL